jgi:hypothetical protein
MLGSCVASLVLVVEFPNPTLSLCKLPHPAQNESEIRTPNQSTNLRQPIPPRKEEQLTLLPALLSPDLVCHPLVGQPHQIWQQNRPLGLSPRTLSPRLQRQGHTVSAETPPRSRSQVLSQILVVETLHFRHHLSIQHNNKSPFHGQEETTPLRSRVGSRNSQTRTDPKSTIPSKTQWTPFS